MDKRFVVYIVAPLLAVSTYFSWLGLIICSLRLRPAILFPSPLIPPRLFFLHYTYVRAMSILQNRRCTLVSSPAGLDAIPLWVVNCDIRLLFLFCLVQAGQGIAYIVLDIFVIIAMIYLERVNCLGLN
jgi:hypothetical protein